MTEGLHGQHTQRTPAPPRVEQGLEELFAVSNPEPAFVAALERQLLAAAHRLPGRDRASQRRTLWTGWFGAVWRHRGVAVAASLLLILALTVAAIGPARVVAAIQDLVGYVPGIGFVDLEETRLLAVPVEVTRGGVTLRVEQVIASLDRTEVVVRTEGLRPEDVVWDPGAELSGARFVLRLPNDRGMTSQQSATRFGEGTLEFGPVPEGMYRVTIELERLPGVPAGGAPENWSVPLDLRPATGELVADLFSPPYVPAGVEDTHHGISLRVLAAGHSPEETAVRVQMQWADPEWERPTLGYLHRPQLRDDLGHVYHEGPMPGSGSVVQVEVMPQPSGAIPTQPADVPTEEVTLAFSTVSPSARELVLWVDGVDFEVPAAGRFVVDLSDDPQMGDAWPLDVHLDVAGFPVHLTAMRLVQQEVGGELRTYLLFTVEPVPDQNGRTLHSIGLRADLDVWEGGYGRYRPQARTLTTGLSLRSGASVPSGLVQVFVEGASVYFQGPWRLRWAVPAAAAVAAAGKEPAADEVRTLPVTRHDVASSTHSGLTLEVSEAVQTDRLLAATVRLVDPPAGVALNRVLQSRPPATTPALYVEDNRGRRSDLNGDVSWGIEPLLIQLGADAPPLSDTLNFEPLHPTARRATLHVPAIELFLSGAMSFDVTIPEGIEMSSQDRFGIPASEPWPVDITLEAAGYEVHVSSVYLQAQGITSLLVLIGDDPPDPDTGAWLTAVRPTSITGPDRQPLDLAHAAPYGRTNYVFDLSDPQTGAVLPGRYHFALDGMTVAVPGPWELNWNLGAP
ncbi:MAG: hypothetical protein JXA14_24030 [Anaerolineae bacterium]|nr:hypothetical protein [Anaerolineae bacterium]